MNGTDPDAPDLGGHPQYQFYAAPQGKRASQLEGLGRFRWFPAKSLG